MSLNKTEKKLYKFQAALITEKNSYYLFCIYCKGSGLKNNIKCKICSGKGYL